MILTIEVLLFSLFIAVLASISTGQYRSIEASKIKATIIDMRNLARQGKQTITKQSPYGTDYTSNNDYLQTVLPITYFNSNIINTSPATNNQVILRTYWQQASNPQAYFYKKRLYNE